MCIETRHAVYAVVDVHQRGDSTGCAAAEKLLLDVHHYRLLLVFNFEYVGKCSDEMKGHL